MVRTTDYRAYRSWEMMKQRCSNPHTAGYDRYGGRGISYDVKWKTFKGFFEDMGERPEGKYSLDRIDNNGNYTKENCRWITKAENSIRSNLKHGVSHTKEYKSEYDREYAIKNRERINANKKAWRKRKKESENILQ